MYLNEGKWFKCNERTSKQWFSLNNQPEQNENSEHSNQSPFQDRHAGDRRPDRDAESSKEILCITTERTAIREARERAIDAIWDDEQTRRRGRSKKWKKVYAIERHWEQSKMPLMQKRHDENESHLYITFDCEGTYKVHDTRAADGIGKGGQ